MIDDLTLIANGQELSGWESIRVTRGIERCPSDFEIEMTERVPGEFRNVIIKPGDACTVLLGDDIVITGYVDGLRASISPNSHSIRLVGRGKCADLVDASAEWPGGQISGSTVLGIAQKLALPYSQENGGINVIGDADEVGLPIPQHNLSFGETPFDIIEQICRYRALLAYEMPDGNLQLSRVGVNHAASGFSEGANVEQASVDFRIDQRFSEYVTQSQSLDVLEDLGDVGFLHGVANDPGVTRHRIKYIISEQAGSGRDQLMLRAEWERQRRIGRSQQIRLTTDSWRDKDGVLWTPNTLVPLQLPSLKVTDVIWLISEVSFIRDEQNGTCADLVIMPPDAFLVDLVTPLPFGDVLQALQEAKRQ